LQKGEEQDVKAWEQSDWSSDTWEQDEAKHTVCCGGHVVSTQVGRPVTIKGAQITANSMAALPENNSALGVISSSVQT